MCGCVWLCVLCDCTDGAVVVDAAAGRYTDNKITLGARADSLYEVCRWMVISPRFAVISLSVLVIVVYAPSPVLAQYLFKQFILAGGLRHPGLEHMSTVPDAGNESPQQYFRSMLDMFDRSANVSLASLGRCCSFAVYRPPRQVFDAGTHG